MSERSLFERCQNLFARIKNLYVFTGVTLLSAVLLFALVNFLVGLLSRETHTAKERERDQVVDLFIQRHGIATLRAAYPGMSDQAIRQLLMATGVLGNRYYPYVEFIQSAFVSPEMVGMPEGYRIIGRDQAAWPPPKPGKTVFVFGSSTALGSGVLSHQTIAAYLQKWLRANFGYDVNVYNFGTGAHYSTQEILFFYDWLRKGIKPDLAIFVDGMSDHFFADDRSALSVFLEQSYQRQQAIMSGEARVPDRLRERIGRAALSLPLVRSIMHEPANTPTSDAIVKGVVDTPAKEDTSAKTDFSNLQRLATQEETQLATAVLDRYVVSMKTAAGMGTANGVQTLFVWQPAPLYKYDLKMHPFAMEPNHQLHRVGYPIMFERFKSHVLPPNFAWCADVQDGLHEMLYVDEVHYRPVLAQLVAQCTVQNLLSSGTIDRLGWTQTSTALVTPTFDGDFEARLQNNTLSLIDVATQEPWRLSKTNIRCDVQSDSTLQSSGAVHLTLNGGVAEHYLVIPTDFLDRKEFQISMQTRTERGPGFRLQAWDASAQPNGVIADVAFTRAAMTIQKFNGADIAEGRVVKQGGWYEVTLRVKLPAGLSHVIVQLMGNDGGTLFAPDGSSLTIRNFEIRPASTNG
jgi:hypothetical protein